MSHRADNLLSDICAVQIGDVALQAVRLVAGSRDPTQQSQDSGQAWLPEAGCVTRPPSASSLLALERRSSELEHSLSKRHCPQSRGLETDQLVGLRLSALWLVCNGCGQNSFPKKQFYKYRAWRRGGQHCDPASDPKAAHRRAWTREIGRAAFRQAQEPQGEASCKLPDGCTHGHLLPFCSKTQQRGYLKCLFLE